MDYAKYDELLIEREDRLITVWFNKPESLNAIAGNVHIQLEDFWHDVARDDSVGAIILSGKGRAFCAGANMKNMNARLGGNEAPITGRSLVGPKRLIANMLEVEQPIIGAINGDAVGLGASVALGCDIIVANERARFADTHVSNLGVTAGDGGTVHWPMMMGIHRAKEFLLMGTFLSAADAAKFGWINYALPAEEVMPKARELALKLAYGPRWAIRYTKTTLNKTLRQQLNLTMDTALASEWLCMTTPDHKEAVAAFIEKRPGKFEG